MTQFKLIFLLIFSILLFGLSPICRAISLGGIGGAIGGGIGGMAAGAMGSISVSSGLDSGAAAPHDSSGVPEDVQVTIKCSYPKEATEAMWVAEVWASHPTSLGPPIPSSTVTYTWTILQPGSSPYPVQPSPSSGSSDSINFTFDTPSNPDSYTIKCEVQHDCTLSGRELKEIPIPPYEIIVPYSEDKDLNCTITGTVLVNDYTPPGGNDSYAGINSPSTGISGLKASYLGWTCENLLTRNPGDFTPEGCIEVNVTDNNPTWPPPAGWENRIFVKLYYQIGPREGQEKWLDQDGDGLAETFERYFHKLMFPEDESIVPPPYSDEGGGLTDQAAPYSNCFIYGSDSSFSWTPFSSPLALRSAPGAPVAPVFGENWGQATGDHIFTMTQGIYPRGNWQTINGGSSNISGWPSNTENLDFFWVGPLDFELFNADGDWSQHKSVTTWRLDARKILLPNFYAQSDASLDGILKMVIHVCDGSGNILGSTYAQAETAMNSNGAVFLSQIVMEDNDPPWVNLIITNTQSNISHQYGMPHNTKVRWCNTDDFWEEADDYHWGEDPSQPNCCVIERGHELVEDVRFSFKPFYMDNVNRIWPNYTDPLSYGINQLKTDGSGNVGPESFEIIIHDPLDPDADSNGNIVFQFADVGAYVSHTFRAATPPDNPEFYWIQYHVRDCSAHPGADGIEGNVRGMKIILPVVSTSSTVESLESSSR
jgi:hypothetical protein